MLLIKERNDIMKARSAIMSEISILREYIIQHGTAKDLAAFDYKFDFIRNKTDNSDKDSGIVSFIFVTIFLFIPLAMGYYYLFKLIFG